MLDRKSAPLFKKIDHINLPEPQVHHLDNGIPLYLIQAGTQPVARLEFIFPAGSWFEKKVGQSYFATKMLVEGTSKKDSATISAEIDQFGAFIDLHASMDYVVVTLACLSKHLNSLLPLLQQIIYDAAFPEKEYDILKNIKTQQVRVNNEKNSVLASKKLREILFGDAHPYGRELSVEAIQELALDNVKKFYLDSFMGPYQLILSGNPEKDTIEVLNRLFGKQILTKPSTIQQPSNHIINTDIQVVEKKSSVQSSIRLGKKLFKKTHPDLIDALVFNELLGGYFGSRLMKNIREEKGYTYGISSAVLTLKNEGYFLIGTDVKKENTTQTLEEISKEIQLLQTELVPEEELETVKSYMAGSFLSEINTPFALADKFKAVHLNGLDYKHYSQYIQRINAITSQDIQKIANQYFALDSFSTVVVGGLN